MPYRVTYDPVQDGDDWAIQKNEGGKWKTVGRSPTKEMAEKSINARRASEHGAKLDRK